MKPSSSTRLTTARLPTLLHTTRGPLVILVHAPVPPDQDDWKNYIAALSVLVKNVDCTILVIADGSGPSAVQREMLKEITPKRVRTTVVTDSSIARGIVTLMGWFHANIRAFSPAQIDAAFDYLAVPGVERPFVLKTVASLRAQLAGIAVGNDVDALSKLHETAVQPMDAAVTRLESLRDKLAARRRG